ncbi:MAG: hypothetical protein JXA24_03920 [Proteobacteria bacterium]|nr:hypothetical protein [Pseudomonadota bacterium]
MSFNTVQPDLVRYEMRMVQGVDPKVREQKKPGAFGRFLSGMGKILGSVAMPLSFIFPPAALAAAGMYGVGQIGDQVQQRSYAKAAEKMQRDAPQQAAFPGLEVGGMPVQPASFDISARDQQVMQVLDARGGSMTDMSQRI